MTNMKKASKSLPPLSDRHHSYIERTIKLLQEGCYKDNTLKIDGDIGDYRMKLFRKKDKDDYAKNIHSVFSSSFTQSIMPSDSKARDEIDKIIKSPNRISVTPQPQAKATIFQQPVSEYSKGNIKDVLQEQEYLLYGYLPQYQKRKWFEVKSKPILIEQNEQRFESPTPVLSNKNSNSLPKRHHKQRHIFAYLQHPSYLRTIK